MKIANKFACIQRGSFLNFSAVAVIVMPVAMLFGSTDPARAQCTGHGSCEDVVLISADGRNETGAFTGMDGACYAYEHRGFDGDRQTLGMRRIMNYVGSSFNDEISSFRVAPGCKIVAWEYRDKGGEETTFYSDAEYVGDTWNDRISSYACRCP